MYDYLFYYVLAVEVFITEQICGGRRMNWFVLATYKHALHW